MPPRRERSGLVSRVVPADDLLTEANAVATTISQMSRSAARMAKEAVNRAFESTLAEGLLYERRLFHSAFATDDQSEGHGGVHQKTTPELHPPLSALSTRGGQRSKVAREPAVVGIALLQKCVATLDGLIGHVRQPGRLPSEQLLADQPIVEQVERDPHP